MNIRFDHIGIPVTRVTDGMVYYEHLKTWSSDPADNAYRIEYIHFEEGNPYPPLMRENSHICYDVDEMEPFLKDADEIVDGPAPTADGRRWYVFYMMHGALIELYCDTAPQIT